MDTRTKHVPTAVMARDALRQSALSCADSTTAPTLSRRQFLAAGVLAAGAVHGGEAPACLFDDDFSVCRVEQAGVAVERQAINVKLGADLWCIEPDLFGPHATLHHSVVPAEKRHTLELKRAAFPGIGLSAAFAASIYQSGGNWVVHLSFDEVGQDIECDLRAWIRAPYDTPGTRPYVGALRGDARAIAAGDGNAAFAAVSGSLTFGVDAAMGVSLSSAGGMVLASRRADFMLDRVDCIPVRLLAADHRHASALTHATGPFSDIQLVGLHCLDNEVTLTRVGERQTAFLHVGAAPAGSLVGHGFGRERDASFLLAGADGTLVLRGGATGPHGTRLLLDPYVLLGTINHLREHLRLAAKVQRDPHTSFGLETATMTALVRGLPDELLELELSGRALDAVTVRVQLCGAHVPVPDASAATLSFHTPPALLIHIGKAAALPQDAGDVAYLMIDADSRFDTPLDTAELRLRRSTDSVDLTFRLGYQTLHVARAATRLRQRPLPAAPAAHKAPFHSLTVLFPPQHEFEEVFIAPDTGTTAAARVRAARKTNAKMAPPDRRPLANRQPDLARTRLANDSRLVFCLPTYAPAQDQPLTLAALTDWRSATLVVNRRALPRRAGLKEQLCLTHIDETTKRQDARGKVKAAILGANLGQPEALETAIEPVYRMIVSPDCSARFVTPLQAPSPRHPVLWSAVLDNHADVAMRALWARGMDPALPFLAPKGQWPDAAFDQPFAGALSAGDRQEIVAMSSFYGLGALRRLQPDTPLAFAAGRKAIGMACESQSWKDDPNGMVFMPEQHYCYLDPTPSCSLPQEGVMLARPFDRFRLRLGRAADIDALWSGEPVAQYGNDPFFGAAFSVERYAHRTVQGRDVFVEVLKKGFLFPIGQRATFVKVSYRDYHAWLDDPLGDPTAYLVQEKYIVVNKPKKQFRAYDQPYDAHDFPCQSLTLLTTQTSRLSDECNLDLPPRPTDSTQEPSQGLVFWPTPQSRPDEKVVFAYQIDDQTAPAHLPMLFVENRAAHHPPTMDRLVDWYNNLAATDVELRTMVHGEAVRRYATETRRGDCSFKTREWLLKVRGRLGASGKETYAMDAFMEGQDQPPFYPVVDQATVNVESIERLTGRVGLYLDAAFNPRYVQHGFDAAHNPSEIFLDVLTPGVMLDGSNSQGATGGVASMAAELACMSRKSGTVGGRPMPPAQKAPAAAPAARMAAARSLVRRKRNALAAPASTTITKATIGGDAPRQHDISHALCGDFNPLEFLGDAKLLGLLPLKDVCMAALMAGAPKLVEQTRHGMQEAAGALAEALDAMRKALSPVLGHVAGAVTLCRQRADEALKAVSTQLTLAALYPGLDRALTAVQNAAVRAQDALAPTAGIDLATLQDLASDLKNAVDMLLQELDSIAHNPVPSVVTGALESLQAIGAALRDPARELAKRAGKLLIDAPLTPFVRALCSPPKRYLLVAVFGDAGAPLPDESEVDYEARMLAILRHPADALNSVRDAVLYEAFTKPLLQLLNTVANGRAQLDDVLLWSRSKMVVTISGVVRRDAAALPADLFAAPAERICSAIDAALTPAAIAGLPATLDGILAPAVAAEKGALLQCIASCQKRFNSHQTDANKAITAFLAAEADKATAALITPARRAAYRASIGTLRAAKDALDQADRLAMLIGDDTGWRKLQDAIVAELRKEFDRAVDARLATIRQAATVLRENAAAAAIGIAQQLLDMAAQWTLVRDIQHLGPAVTNLCQSAGADLKMAVERATVGLLADEEAITLQLQAIDDALASANSRLDTLATPSDDATALRTALQARLATLIAAVGAVRALCADMERLRANWQALTDAARCELPGAFDMCGKLAAVRARMPAAFAAAFEAVVACGAAPESTVRASLAQTDITTFKDNVANVDKQLRTLLGAVTGLASIAAQTDDWKAQKNFFDRYAAAQPQIADRVTEIEGVAARWLAAVSADAQTMLAAARQLQRELEAPDRALTAFLVQLLLPGTDFIDAALEALLAAVKGMATLMLAPTSLAQTQAGELRKLIAGPTPAGVALSTLLSRDLLDRLAKADDALLTDQKDLTTLASATDTGAPLPALSARWKNGGSGLALAAKLIGEVVELVTSGKVMTLFRVNDIADALRIAIASFVPTKIALHYDFDAALSDYPSGGPIFLMDRASYGTAKETRYDGDEHFPINDLVLTTRIEVDVLTGQRTINAEGRLRPFTLNLLGSSFDLIGISFGGARFQSKAGGTVAVDTAISGVRIGAMLEFLSLIQNYFSSGTDNGLYYNMSFLPPSLEVGYRYNEPYLEIGAMVLLNIGFRVGARLPLDDRPAEFFCDMSTRDKPLLIVMAPYGGGGFFGLRANSRGIVSFEIQLEFGFVGALVIGPLSAQARATAGIYLKQGDGERILEGFFHAIGEGHLGCFGIGVDIEIKMRQESDGTMVGSASYAYSFKVGIFKIEFKVEASRSQGNGKSGGQSSAALHRAPQPALRAFAAAPAGIEAHRGAQEPTSLIRNAAVRKEQQWNAYKPHLDLKEPA